MGRVLIIGYGNPLRGDDGFGWHAAERLRETAPGSRMWRFSRSSSSLPS